MQRSRALWDRGGLAIYFKRLERGRFRKPRVTIQTSHVEMDATALAMLLDGIDVSRVRRPEHWEPPPPKRVRRANAELRAKRLETERIDVPVPADERHCPKCGGEESSVLKSDKPSSVTEYVPGYFRKRTFWRE